MRAKSRLIVLTAAAAGAAAVALAASPGGATASSLAPLGVPFHGRVAVTGPRGEHLICPVPVNPYAHSSVGPMMAKSGLSIRKYTKRGRTPMFTIKANLGGVGQKWRPGPIVGATLRSIQPLRSIFSASDSVVATNSSFFDFGKTGMPNGVEVMRGGHVVKATSAHTLSLVQTDNRQIHIATVWGLTQVRGKYATINGSALNAPYLPRDSFSVFDSNWGASPPSGFWTSQPMREYLVVNHRVVGIWSKVEPGVVPPRNGFIIVAQGNGMHRLSLAGVGAHTLAMTGTSAHSLMAGHVDSAAGIGQQLIKNGRYQGPVCSYDSAVARTIVGIYPGHTAMFVAVVQGQTDAAHRNFSGLNVRDSAALAYTLGALDAVMFDGGGSAGIVARMPHVAQLTVSPGNYNRSIPQGWAFWPR